MPLLRRAPAANASWSFCRKVRTAIEDQLGLGVSGGNHEHRVRLHEIEMHDDPSNAILFRDDVVLGGKYSRNIPLFGVARSLETRGNGRRWRGAPIPGSARCKVGVRRNHCT